MNSLKLVFILAFLFVGYGLSAICLGQTELPPGKEDRDIVQRAERKYLGAGSENTILRFYGDKVIEAGEHINDYVLVIKGDLSIRGQVDRDVLVVWGNVRVYNTGKVRGNITSVGGTIEVFDNGVVLGDMLETNSKNLYVRNKNLRRVLRGSMRRDRYGTIPISEKSENILFKYNRVEGLFLGMQFPKNFIPRVGHLSAHGFLGYGFKSKDVRFQIGLDRWFFSPVDYRFELGAELHSLTESKDLWRMPYFENTLAALLFREDFHDYFQREGYSFHVSQNLTPYVKSELAYRQDDYASLSNHASWSLFGDKKRFRQNPPIAEGNMRSIYGEVLFDNRNDLDFTTTGWYALASGEVASSKLGGDFSFNRCSLDVRYFQPVSTGENLNVRLMLGTSEGELPVQKNFEIGGISTLRGYRFKEFTGDSFFLVNLEYRIHSRILGAEFPLLGDDFSLILFTDFGDAWNGVAGDNMWDRLQMFRVDRLKNDVGIAIADPEGEYRLNIAKRTDTSENNFVVTFRISQPF